MASRLEPRAWHLPDEHPISELIDRAQKTFSKLIPKRSISVEQAAQQYRTRRGRHPPSGFDAWFEAAQSKDAIIIEQFFDQIHHDLAPFWAMDPWEMRRRASLQPQRIQIRQGEISIVAEFGNLPKRRDWMELWTGVLKEIVPHIPNPDMVINVLDESRMLVPWEDIARYTAVEQIQRHLFPIEEAKTEYTYYSGMDMESHNKYEAKWIEDQASNYWNYLKATCPPDSPAREFDREISTLMPAGYIEESYPITHWPIHRYHGFVSNSTASQDACHQPHLRSQHRTFVQPGAISSVTSLVFPMFGGSKLPQNNEILIPGAMYLTEEERYSGGSGHGGAWSEKKDGLVWRATVDNWWKFHRHRFVQMMNGSAVSLLEDGAAPVDPKMDFRLPRPDDGDADLETPAQKSGRLGSSLAKFADVGFVWMYCDPVEYNFWGRRKDTCPYTDPYYTMKHKMTMKEHSSLPLKATVYTEQHDHRLIPWLHFVPFDNTFSDIYAVLDYFQKHDMEARRIAEEGQKWAQKVLRREDMVLYMWRLLLEYARVMDPHRDRLGYVEDLNVPS
ncbi:hypothetical protein BX600DRAFT_482121 [Xylariales sp. PMI_506]|nr:hypothetical protein BX600DRAFT_482121 [Xylariales sp. PMI_506]